MSSELAEYFLSLLIPFSIQLPFPRAEILVSSLPAHTRCFVPIASEVL